MRNVGCTMPAGIDDNIGFPRLVKLLSALSNETDSRMDAAAPRSGIGNDRAIPIGPNPRATRMEGWRRDDLLGVVIRSYSIVSAFEKTAIRNTGKSHRLSCTCNPNPCSVSEASGAQRENRRKLNRQNEVLETLLFLFPIYSRLPKAGRQPSDTKSGRTRNEMRPYIWRGPRSGRIGAVASGTDDPPVHQASLQ